MSPRTAWARHPLLVLAAGSLLLAALGTALLPLGAGYDPLAWSIWAAELAAGDLDTRAGPAFKPLPVLLTAPVAGVLGADAGLAWWLLLARAGTLLAAGAGGLLAARLVRELVPSGPAIGPRRAAWAPVAAGVGAAVAILLCARLIKHGLLGVSEPLVGLAAVGVLLEHRAGRPGRAWAWALAAALLRPETWLVVGPYGLWLLVRRPRVRPWVVAGGLALPLLWFGLEQWGSGDWRRSSTVANVPNPGQPALSAFPFGVSLGGTLGIPPTPVLLAGLLAPLPALRLRGLRRVRAWPAAERDLLVLAALGLGLVLLTAVMAELGFSGEGRYALPGLMLLMVAGAVALVRLAFALRVRPPRPATRPWILAGTVVAVLLVLVRVPAVPRDVLAVQRQLGSQRALAGLVDALGGPAAIRACGRPVSGRAREPVLARALALPIAEVARRVPTTGPVVVFRARLTPEDPVGPPSPRPLRPSLALAPWTVATDCAPRAPLRSTGRPVTTAPGPSSVWIP